MSRVAIIGAGGFVGSRWLEIAALHDRALVPVIRSYRAYARIARLAADCKVGDTSNVDFLCSAIADCDTVVNLTMGDNARMLSDVRTMHRACEIAGVRRFIHLSSAEVYGRAESDQLTDDSPWLRNHWMEYARAKGAAEDWLRGQMKHRSVSSVVLRPGLIWGPKSGWTAGPAQAIIDGHACLVDGGRGICNLVYVDNLIAQIEAVLRERSVAGGFFNVSDAETVNWRDYYQSLASEVGVSFESIAQIEVQRWRSSFTDRLKEWKDSPVFRPLKRRLRSQTKGRLKHLLLRLAGAVPTAPGPVAIGPKLTRSMWWLQTTRHKLPTAKFRATFGNPPLVPYSEAVRRTGEWLRFAGFLPTRPA